MGKVPSVGCADISSAGAGEDWGAWAQNMAPAIRGR